MKVYLAGPMRGLPDFNFPAFHKAAANLRAIGRDVWSPAEKDEADGFDPTKDEALPLRDYMKVDLPAVLDSDCVIVLPDWHKSKGASLEVLVAQACDIPVWEYHETQAKIPGWYIVALQDNSNETILEEAQRLVYGDRNRDYGHPANDFARTAKMWSAILGTEVTAKQAALCMAAVKISRECNAAKRDNLVDLAGYAAVAYRIERRAAGLE